MIATPHVPHYAVGGFDDLVRLSAEMMAEDGVTHAGVFLDSNVADSALGRQLIDAISHLTESTIVVAEFSEPDRHKILSAVRKLPGNVDLLVAVGGGSTIDTAKMASICHQDPDFTVPVSFVVGTDTRLNRLPIWAWPTTAGTASELSPAAVYAVEGRKTAYVHKGLVPDRAFVAPEFLKTVPPPVLAASLGDAVVHSLEGLMSTRGTFLSTAMHLAAVPAVRERLTEELGGGSDQNRSLLCEASFLSGLGARVAGANVVHALATPISILLRVPHGVATVSCLGGLLTFAARRRPKEMQELELLLEGGELEKLEKWLRDLPIPALPHQGKLSELMDSPEVYRLLDAQSQRFAESRFNVSVRDAADVYDLMGNDS